MAKKKATKKSKAKSKTPKSKGSKRITSTVPSSTTPGKSSTKTSSRTTRVRRNEVVCVFGRKGSGKSYRIHRLIEQIPTSRRVMIWDPVSEYAGRAAEDPILHAQLFGDVHQMLQEAAKGGLAQRVVMQAPRGQFDVFCTFCYRAGNMAVVVDEVNLFCKPGQCPAPLLELLRIGRHASVDLIFAARRPAEVARDLTAQADRIEAYKTIEPNDLKWFSDVCGKSFADSLPNLPEFQSSTFTG